MSKFEVVNPVKHDGTLYKVGEFIEAAVEDMEELIGMGHVKAPAELSAQDRTAEIKAAIEKLDPEDSDLWLRDGKPDTNAISAITGWPVSAAERNAVWESMKSGSGAQD